MFIAQIIVMRSQTGKFPQAAGRRFQRLFKSYVHES